MLNLLNRKDQCHDYAGVVRFRPLAGVEVVVNIVVIIQLLIKCVCPILLCFDMILFDTDMECFKEKDNTFDWKKHQ